QKEAAKHVFAQFLVEREQNREKMAREESAEADKLRRFQEELDNRSHRAAKEKRDAASTRDAIYNRLASELERRIRDNQLLERIGQELAQAMEEERIVTAQREKDERARRLKRELLEAARESKAARAVREAEIRAQEEEYRQDLMAKIEEEAQRQRMTAAQIERQKEVYRKDLTDSIEERRQARIVAARAAIEEEERLLVNNEEYQ
ncbi:hypothetical protein KIPB_013447, partial [Kipferlia bialata]